MRWLWFLLAAACALVLTWNASAYLSTAADTVKALAAARNEADIQRLGAELERLKAELASLRAEVSLARDASTRVLEKVADLETVLVELMDRFEGGPMPPPNEMGGPPVIPGIPRNPFFDAMVFSSLDVLKRFAALAKGKADRDGVYWDDGRFEFEGLELPQGEVEVSFRYFASPDSKKFTLVVFPLHREMPPEPELRNFRFAFALTQEMKLYVCRHLPVEGVEDLSVEDEAWNREEALPAQGDWEPVPFDLPEKPVLRALHPPR